MTYEIEIIEPSVQKIIQELANLNLLKFRPKSKSVKKTEENHSRKEVLEGWQENVNELRGAIKEGKPMRSAWALLAELEKEAA